MNKPNPVATARVGWWDHIMLVEDRLTGRCKVCVWIETQIAMIMESRLRIEVRGRPLYDTERVAAGHEIDQVYAGKLVEPDHSGEVNPRPVGLPYDGGWEPHTCELRETAEVVPPGQRKCLDPGSTK